MRGEQRRPVAGQHRQQRHKLPALVEACFISQDLQQHRHGVLRDRRECLPQRMLLVNQLRQVPGHQIARCSGERPAQCRPSEVRPRIREANEDSEVCDHPDHGIEVPDFDGADDVPFDELESLFEARDVQRGKDAEQRGQVIPGRRHAAGLAERHPGGVTLLYRDGGSRRDASSRRPAVQCSQHGDHRVPTDSLLILARPRDSCDEVLRPPGGDGCRPRFVEGRRDQAAEGHLQRRGRSHDGGGQVSPGGLLLRPRPADQDMVEGSQQLHRSHYVPTGSLG